MKKICILGTVVFILFGCKKEVAPATENAEIIILTPAMNSASAYNDSLSITGTAAVTANAPEGTKLHGFDVFIRKEGDTAALYSYHNHAHATSLTINTKWYNNAAAGTRMTLEVKTYTDHSGSFVAKQVAFVSK